MIHPYFTAGTKFSAGKDTTTNCYGRNGMMLLTEGGCLRFEDEADAENLAVAILTQQGIDLVDLNILKQQTQLQRQVDAGARKFSACIVVNGTKHMMPEGCSIIDYLEVVRLAFPGYTIAEIKAKREAGMFWSVTYKNAAAPHPRDGILDAFGDKIVPVQDGTVFSVAFTGNA